MNEVTNLDCTVILVVAEAERAESTVHTVQAIHVAFTLVRISVKLALNKEVLFQQRLQPWWPPVVIFFRSSSTLFKINPKNC